MNKLTLSVDDNVVEKAKQIADANHTSVSAMFSQFIQSMASPQARPRKVAPLTRKLSGIVKLPRGKDYKELLTDALAHRYGVRK